MSDRYHEDRHAYGRLRGDEERTYDEWDPRGDEGWRERDRVPGRVSTGFGDYGRPHELSGRYRDADHEAQWARNRPGAPRSYAESTRGRPRRDFEYRGPEDAWYGLDGPRAEAWERGRRDPYAAYGQGAADWDARRRWEHEASQARSPRWERDQPHHEHLMERIQHLGRDLFQRTKRLFRTPKGYTRSDERIREDICERLGQSSSLDASEIEVQVSNGEVTYSGSVNERYMKYFAEHIADDVAGVTEIHNQLRVKREGGTAPTSVSSIGRGGQRRS